ARRRSRPRHVAEDLRPSTRRAAAGQDHRHHGIERHRAAPHGDRSRRHDVPGVARVRRHDRRSAEERRPAREAIRARAHRGAAVNGGSFAVVLTPFARAKESLTDVAATTGQMGIVAAQIVMRLVRIDLDGRELMRNMYKMGVKSLPIVVVTALFTGAIMVVQAAPIVQRYGAQGPLGWGAGFGTLREIGPLLTALMISGRVR